MITFVISTAVDRDLVDLHSFLFERPHQNIRQRSRFEVKRMIEDRLFLVARRNDNGRIVGACYIDTPHDDSPEEAFEFGGAFVHPEFRGIGLFRILGRVAIVNLFLTNNPTQPLIAHVLVSNPGPRSGLNDLGFRVQQANIAFQPAQLAGLEHMETDEEGFVYADVLEFDRDNFARLINEEVDFTGRLPDLDGRRCSVSVRVPAWHNDKQILREALRHLGTRE